jgi:putative FmdB family regulatory protein
MPIYEYVCPTCKHGFDKLQPMGLDTAECPRCEQPANRLISLFAAVSMVGNGESVPVPVTGIGGGCCAGGGCGCSL